MKYANLGRTGLRVSRLCLGTMNFGSVTSEDDSFAIMDKALETGINFFDTADIYGKRKYEGYTEQILGKWFASRGGRRERVVLATKVYNPMGEGANDRGNNAYHIKRGCEASLKRLCTDHIDLYQMHHIDRAAPWDETWQAMEQLVREGKITYVGSSNFAAWDIVKANETAARRYFLGLVSEQSKYSLDSRTIELEVIPACRDYGVGIIAWSPLAGGLLGGGVKQATEGRRTQDHIRRGADQRQNQLSDYDGLCGQLGEEPANVALAWILANPGVTGPIIGPRTLDQLTESLRALEIGLDEATLKRLDQIWPGPGGEAPEAYAW